MENINFGKNPLMKVFKFGGASVINAEGIKNLGKIITGFDYPMIVVVSALGKTTNKLEAVVNSRYEKKGDPLLMLKDIFDHHLQVIEDLGVNDKVLVSFMDSSFNRLNEYLTTNEAVDYDREYDQVVSAGELWSSRIIASWLEHEKHNCRWIDIRQVLLTDTRFRDANILWGKSLPLVKNVFTDSGIDIFLTQGFIAGTGDGLTATLGREGSDYTAAVLANMTDASEVQVWKDVPGVLNADPKWLEDAQVLKSLSYKEAVEMSFSGAKIIHPKTIKPLHNKGIPLIVRSFMDRGAPGTLIMGEEAEKTTLPVFIRKEDQILISVLSRDFSFAIGDNLTNIFRLFYDYGVKVNLVQASAVSVAVCADDDGRKIRRLISQLESQYRVIYNSRVEMLTIRQYTPEAISRVCRGREILLEQKTRLAVRLVVKMH